MPPTRSERVGLTSRLPRELPCAVATSCTPRSAMVHAARSTNTRMWNIPIAGNFIGSIYDHNTFIGFIRKNAGYFTQQSGFTHTWTTKYQDGLTLFDNITN